jgi:small subunit ribosomal protein S16
MAVKIRLTRRGAKKNPFYRVIAADSRSPRDGRFLEVLGTYDPRKDPPKINIEQDKLNQWVNRGAQMSAAVSQLVKRAGFGRKGEEEVSPGETKEE